MSELYVGNLALNITTREIEREFQPYGEILCIKIPNSFSTRGYAFVEFKDRRDALFAIHSWNAKFNWRVELSRNSQWVSATFVRDSGVGSSSGGGRGGFGSNNCYSCGGSGHFSRDCLKDIKNKGVIQKGSMKKNQVASTSIWQPVPPPPPPWVELPEDITAKILEKLGPVGLLWPAQKVCTTWRKICRDPTMWRVINMWKLYDVEDIYDLPYNANEELCRLAVNLSQGQVSEINIEDFGSDDLLEYIAERCGQLRCLRLAFCDDISAETLSKAVKGFPQLEELHLQCTPVEAEDIEAIAQSCPMLKKFALNGRGCKAGILKSSEEALAVAKSMPELCHLQMFGNRMTNEALEAILNGCPKLESLDLRQCFNLDLEGELGKRCAQQIKNLRRPHDSTNDYEWDTRISDWGACGHEYFSDLDSFYDYDYDDLDYEDFCDPYQFDAGSEDSFFEEYFGMFQR